MQKHLSCGGAFVVALAFVAAPAFAAGTYKLAWWREKGTYENGAGAGCVGNLVIDVWVFDQTGNPKSGVQLKTTWNVLLATTDSDGRGQVILDVNNRYYDMICVDGLGSTSEVALEMSSRRQPCWGHYSYEVGFLYKTDTAAPGTFDTNLNCTLNTGCVDYGCAQETDAPYTKSLAFNSINCADYRSDEMALGNWQAANSYFGQTFVATANRVIAVRAHCAIGGNDQLAFNAQIVTWPGMTPVGPMRSTPVRYPFGWVIFWGANDVQVTPGQTYMLKISRDGSGTNAWHVVRNNYASGQYYEGATAYSDRDLEGFVCCMDYGNQPNINITSGPTANNLQPTQATIAWTTDVASDSRVEYGLTAAYGQQASNPAAVTSHSITLTGLTSNQTYHYRVISTAAGYNQAASSDRTFATPATATGTISGTTTDSGGTSLDEVIVTTTPGSLSTSSSGGAFTLANVPIGTYSLNAWKPGYCEANKTGVQVTAGATTTTAFALEQAANAVSNSGFNADLAGWTTFGNGVTWNSAWRWAIPSHTGAGYAGYIGSYVGAAYNGGLYQRVTGLQAGRAYDVSTYAWTDSWEGGDRQNEYPNNVQVRLGVDLTGGTDPAGAGVTWTAYTTSFIKWTPLKLAVTPTGASITVFLQYGIADSHEWNKAAFDDVYVSPVQCSYVPPPIKPDFDQDGDVDMADFGHFQMCLTGPGVQQTETSCQDADLDGDGDVDQTDCGIFQGCVTGTNMPSIPSCMH